MRRKKSRWRPRKIVPDLRLSRQVARRDTPPKNAVPRGSFGQVQSSISGGVPESRGRDPPEDLRVEGRPKPVSTCIPSNPSARLGARTLNSLCFLFIGAPVRKFKHSDECSSALLSFSIRGWKGEKRLLPCSAGECRFAEEIRRGVQRGSPLPLAERLEAGVGGETG